MTTPRRPNPRALALVLAIGSCLALAAWLASEERSTDENASLMPAQRTQAASKASQELRAPAAGDRGAVEGAVAPERSEGRARVEAGADPSAGAIRGTVVLPDGTPAGAGVLVVATPGRGECPLEFAEQLREAPESGTAALTDGDGAFTIVGLRRSADYSLTIGGAGFVGHQRQWITNTDRPDGVYRVMRLYGYVVSLTEASGAPIRLHAGLLGQRAGQGRLKIPGVFPLTGTPAAAVLAGITPDDLRGGDVGRRTLLYTSAEDALELGPITFQANLPGYAPLSLEVRARAVTEGLARYAARVEPTSAGFGQLEVTLAGWRGPGPAFVGPDGPGATLHLQSVRGVRVAFALGPFEDGRILVEGLPYGTWRCSLGAPGAMVNLARAMTEEHEVEIGTRPERYIVDLDAVAVCELVIETADGVPWTGRASVVYASAQSPREGWKSQHFRSAPYRLDGLEPGSYRLALRLPFPAGTSVEEPVTMSLRGGECSRIELRER
ncbi:MAG: carboxypeptidase-like regulatory domain-containing protein [Planctomycetota bacterium]|jgi:hypothetical protein|nr:carboxypeptidase-like regulatory domain-containing protein [Planctomycetota bacterium]MDP6761698.1 carboxypeptidase-like regulatory domain-containing protein [Planctomycetota bacterium]MDP6990188.1 carboxypeptidase-like regulatory domain-containing protein [Planctomycetota bacterium]